jgi:hypothetical protein
MNPQRISEKYPRNLPCPCGSGKKYKKCCIHKDFEFALDNTGETDKMIPMTEQTEGVIDRQRELFIEKFGRPPEPHEPIFFDPTADTPQKIGQDTQKKMEQATLDIMHKTGMRPELIYAYKKTGRMVTQENSKLLTDIELKEWDDAIDEYFSQNKPL